MWPFKRKKKPVLRSIPPEQIRFSQLDITERFNDDEALSDDDWIETTPLNARIPDPLAWGLPSLEATSEQVYAEALRLSQMRESIQIQGDGVYCPICHIANKNLDRLRTPCPKCRRGLLRFGWT